jgi:Bacterial toxin 44
MQAAQPSSLQYAGLSDFINLVQPKGAWDFKYGANEKGGRRGYYFFGDTLYSAEDYGNIHYGYVGTAGGFAPWALAAGAGAVQENKMSGWYGTFFNDPRDQENTARGIAAYYSSLYTQLYTTPGGAVVSAGGVFAQQPSQGSSGGGSSSSGGGSAIQGSTNNGGWGNAHSACGTLCI